ncbi:MAG: hypothetical protein D6743_01055 [Calditrichaeota bacterium]|nr:MAG: hypothetical protein D6743_01055 [Calditrichota bacterium]
MSELASHYERMRKRYPDDRLMIVFDIDGTILDMRYMIFFTLKKYDKVHRTHLFDQLQLADVSVHENQLERLLENLGIPPKRRGTILNWYEKNRWSSRLILQSHRPFAGVLEVIRWFQLQPKTYVGLDTGRPQALRRDTLRSLNELGTEYCVRFSEDLLYMNPDGWEHGVKEAKVSGIQHFQSRGFRVFAFVDNEPENLNAVSRLDPDHEILLLHADTIFESKRQLLPSRSVEGNTYDLTELIQKQRLPRHVRFVWHGINDEKNLQQFLDSEITWGECDVMWDPVGYDLILRHDSFKQRPLEPKERWLTFESILRRFLERGKSIKIDLKAGGALIDKVLRILADHGVSDDRVWFNGNVEHLQESGIRKIARAHPKAVLQCPVDFLAPLVVTMPEKAKEMLDLYRSWGVNLFSISWLTDDIRPFFDQMYRWGFEVNIYNVPDLASFLQAVLLMPRSITSDFNFPQWHYYGRGAGKEGSYHEYAREE